MVYILVMKTSTACSSACSDVNHFDSFSENAVAELVRQLIIGDFFDKLEVLLARYYENEFLHQSEGIAESVCIHCCTFRY